MGAPLFLVDELPAGDGYRLDGPEGRHAATVQRLRVGEHLIIADGRGGSADARVAAAGRDWLDLTVTDRTFVAAPEPRVTVVQGIAKGDRGELAVATMTEVGVDRIVPWPAARSVARWKDDKPLSRWRATARESAKQARRPWVPDVTDPRTTAQVAAALPAAAFVLHEAATTPLSTVELPTGGEIALVVGPEGGIDEHELATFAAAGATPVRLGAAVLRTSTAGAAAVAALSVLLHRW